MQKRSTAPARAVALVALVAAFLVLIVVVANSLGGGSSTGSGTTSSEKTVTQKQRKVPTKAIYVVQSGDTLTSIAHKTGVSVVRIQDLNPNVDPQILISGEKLKLR